MNRLKEIRLENRYLQKDIAKILNIKQNTYSQYETGAREIPVEAMIVLAKFYDVSLDYIFCLTDEERSYK